MIVQGDALKLPLADESVDLIITSPPYFALRSYRDDGEHYSGQIGSEETPEAFLDALDRAMVEMGRVLKGSGSVFINLGDKYSGAGPQNAEGRLSSVGNAKHWQQVKPRFARSKSLMGLPWRYAIRQIDNGWILRAELIWSKPNGLPESVTDRVRRSHEQWFHLVKEPRYFSAVDEIREPYAPGTAERYTAGYKSNTRTEAGQQTTPSIPIGVDDLTTNPLGRLPGSVWTIPTEPLKVPDGFVDHFAAFPQEWPRRFILGWSPSGICTVCGEGRRPVVSKTATKPPRGQHDGDKFQRARSAIKGGEPSGSGVEAIITSYACGCPTPGAPTRPAVILDPFGGTGTVAGVARKLGRTGISLDLSMDYSKLAKWRAYSSGHFDKTLKRTMGDRQGTLL